MKEFRNSVRLPVIDVLRPALSFDNRKVRFVVDCDKILNALAFDRWSMDNCPALIPTNSPPHNCRPLIDVCRRPLLVRNAIKSEWYTRKWQLAWERFDSKSVAKKIVYARREAKGLLTNFSKLGQPVAKWASVKSVIWLHSSKSMRSKYLQFCFYNGIHTKSRNIYKSSTFLLSSFLLWSAERSCCKHD